MRAQLSALLIQALIALAGLAVTALGVLLARLAAKLPDWIKNKTAVGILQRLDALALVVVQQVEQQVVSVLDPTKPLGSNATLAKDAAMASLKSHLGATGIQEIKNAFGLSAADVEAMLSSYIEAKVLEVKTPPIAPVTNVTNFSAPSLGR